MSRDAPFPSAQQPSRSADEVARHEQWITQCSRTLGHNPAREVLQPTKNIAPGSPEHVEVVHRKVLGVERSLRLSVSPAQAEVVASGAPGAVSHDRRGNELDRESGFEEPETEVTVLRAGKLGARPEP